MCTFTILPRDSGYIAAMNRDEQRTRVTALPPEIRRLGETEVMAPREPAGGTWISVNATGNTLALLNWYSVPCLGTRASESRGNIIRQAGPVMNDLELAAHLETLTLANYRPFRLVAVFPGEHRIVERQWDGRRLRVLHHSWRATVWISSGLDEAGANMVRHRVFTKFLTQLQPAAPTHPWAALRSLHASHDPEPGPYSFCMHRRDAVTVSCTEIQVNDRECRMWYHAGSPCQRKETSETRLQRPLKRRPRHRKSFVYETGQHLQDAKVPA